LKKLWSSPELVVVVRRTSEEVILAACKTASIHPGHRAEPACMNTRSTNCQENSA
jgi:hypothetical protein